MRTDIKGYSPDLKIMTCKKFANMKRIMTGRLLVAKIDSPYADAIVYNMVRMWCEVSPGDIIKGYESLSFCYARIDVQEHDIVLFNNENERHFKPYSGGPAKSPPKISNVISEWCRQTIWWSASERILNGEYLKNRELEYMRSRSPNYYNIYRKKQGFSFEERRDLLKPDKTESFF